MASVIPFGQPILVGHHSETRDRNYRNRIHNKFSKSFGLTNQADEAERRANSVSNAISADDEDALSKLKAKLDDRQRRQETMKQANKFIRSENLTALFDLVGEVQGRKLLAPDFGGCVGFASYQLSNNSANIRSIKQRIKQLEREEATPEAEERAGEGYVIREEKEDNRIHFVSDGKPPAETRTILKKNGFKWSPSRGAWVRMLNYSGRWSAEYIHKQLSEG